jgi:hypothetical protein
MQLIPVRTLLILALLNASAAIALDCPEPPVQSRKDWDTQVRTEVAKIGPVKGAELQTRVRSTTQDLLSRLPGADRVYLEQMMFASYCSALRDDHAITESAKAKQLLEYRRLLAGSLRR